MSKYCHRTTDFISQINENMSLDFAMRDDIEKTSRNMIVNRMLSFIKNNILPTPNFLIDKTETGDLIRSWRCIKFVYVPYFQEYDHLLLDRKFT